MKYKFVLGVFALVLSVVANAQNGQRNAAYGELGGRGLFFSTMYERQLTKKPRLFAGAGIGYYYENNHNLMIPLYAQYLIPITKTEGKFLSVGFGPTFNRSGFRLFKDDEGLKDAQMTHWIPSVGYRRHYPSRVMFSATAQVVINRLATTPWVGLGVGYRW